MQRTLDLHESVLEALGADARHLTALMDGLSYVWRVAVIDNESVLEPSEWHWLRTVLKEAVINPRQHPGELITSAIDEAVTFRLVATREDANAGEIKRKIGGLDRFQALVLLHTLTASDVNGVHFWELEHQVEQRRKASVRMAKKRGKQTGGFNSDRTPESAVSGTPKESYNSMSSGDAEK